MPAAAIPFSTRAAALSRPALIEGACLVAVTLIALFLRTVYLNQISLWTDEFITLITVRRPLSPSLLQLEDYAGPLHQLLLRLFVHEPDPPAWLLRSPAIACGVLGVPAAWWLARMVGGRWVALLVAGLVAINPELILHAREARQNTLFVLLATLAIGFFLRTIRTGSRGRATACTAATTLLLYTHYFGFLVVGAQAAYLVLRGLRGRRLGKSERLAWAALVVSGFLGLPALWLMSRYLGANAPATVGWIKGQGLAGHFALFATLMGVPPDFPANAVLGALVAVVAIAWGFFPSPSGRGWRVIPPGEGVGGGSGRGLGGRTIGETTLAPESREGEHVRSSQGLESVDPRSSTPSPGRSTGHPLPGGEGKALCALWLVFAFFPFVAAYYLYRPLLVERYALPAIVPALILLLSAAAGAGRRLAGPRGDFVAAALVAALLASMALAQFRRETTYRSDMRSLVAWVHSQAGADDVVLVADWSYSPDYINPERVALEYYGLTDQPILTLGMEYPDHIHVLDPGQIVAGRKSFIIAWVSLQESIRAHLNETGRRFSEQEFGGLHVFEVEAEDERR